MPIKRLVAFSGAIIIVAALMLARPASAISSASLVVQVYSDGSVLVTQQLAVSPSSGTAQVTLLTAVLSDVVATDQNGSPLSWKVSGMNLTVYTLGATGVKLSYDTIDLTNKTGTVWELGFVSDYNTTVVLPRSSTVTSISGTPYTLQIVNGSPVATISPGYWKIDYGVPISSTQTTTTTGSVTQGTTGTETGTSTGGTSGSGTGGGPGSGVQGVGQPQLEEIAAALLGTAAVAAGFVWWRRRGLGPQSAELRPDDVKVITFIQEQGGKVLEPEIRTRFALPKTSGWRQIKRLERLGYVKVTKIGSQNQIELVKKREGTPT